MPDQASALTTRSDKQFYITWGGLIVVAIGLATFIAKAHDWWPDK